MSHCDPQMSDQVKLDPPMGLVTKVKESSTATRGETGAPTAWAAWAMARWRSAPTGRRPI